MQNTIVDTAARSILEAYKAVSGNELTFSIADYLLIRKAALEEISVGIKFETKDESISVPIELNPTVPTPISQPTTMSKSAEVSNTELVKKPTKAKSKSTTQKPKEQKPEKPKKSDFEILRGLTDEWN